MSDQKVELYANTSMVMNDAIDRIVVEIHNRKKEDNRAEKLLLTACGPQSGTTATSIALGISFAAAHWRTLIVDCDLRKSNDMKKLNQNTGVGLSDYLVDNVGNKSFSDLVYSTSFDNLSYVPSGMISANPARLLCSDMMKKFMDFADSNFDYVIFDFPSIAVVPDAQTLFNDVDGIILLSAIGEVTKRQIKEAKHKVEPFADKYYGMIINKIDMDQYSKRVEKFDYYFLDKNGNQKLGGNRINRMKKENSEKSFEISSESEEIK